MLLRKGKKKNVTPPEYPSVPKTPFRLEGETELILGELFCHDDLVNSSGKKIFQKMFVAVVAFQINEYILKLFKN